MNHADAEVIVLSRQDPASRPVPPGGKTQGQVRRSVFYRESGEGPAGVRGCGSPERWRRRCSRARFHLVGSESSWCSEGLEKPISAAELQAFIDDLRQRLTREAFPQKLREGFLAAKEARPLSFVANENQDNSVSSVSGSRSLARLRELRSPWPSGRLSNPAAGSRAARRRPVGRRAGDWLLSRRRGPGRWLRPG